MAAERPRDELGRPLPWGATGVPPVPELDRDDAETLRLAQELIDTGRPFAAHEVLEARWKSCADGRRDHWQGLAQAAVALTHLRRGNRTGARRLADRALSNGAAAPGSALEQQLRALAAGDDQGLNLKGSDA